MKVDFQKFFLKLIFLLLVFTVMIVFTVPVYAEDTPSETSSDSGGLFEDYDDSHGVASVPYNSATATKKVLELSFDLANGTITTDQFLSEVAAVDVSLLGANTRALLSDPTGIKALSSPADVARAVLDSVRSDITAGGGTVSTIKPVRTHQKYAFPDGGYIEFSPKERGSQPGRYDVAWKYYYSDGTLGDHGILSCAMLSHVYTIVDVTFDHTYSTSAIYNVTVNAKFNGNSEYERNYFKGRIDIPYSGSDVPEFVEEPGDASDLSDEELIDVIDKMIETLETTYPDLSTVEGLLQAILNEINKLEGGGKCDCSDILNNIYALLKDMDFTTDNKELVAVLTELKNLLEKSTDSSGETDISAILDKLDTICTKLDELKDSVDSLTDEEKDDFHSGMLSLIGKFKEKIGLDVVQENIDYISTTLFAERDFSVDEHGIASVSFSDSVPAESAARASSSVFAPHIYVEIMGHEYDLFSSLSRIDSSYLETCKSILAAFLWVSFLIGFFRSLPGLLMSVERVSGQNKTE